MTRYALAGLFMVGLIAIVYVLMSAGGGKTDTNPYAKFATGAMEKLDFTTTGDPASDASFLTADGGTGSLADLRGKVILVNFWATWCSPCEKEMPALGALEQARGGKDFEVVAISVDSEADLAYAQQRLGELGASDITFRATPPENDNYELVYDSGVRGFPTSILYDREGKEIARLSGDADWNSFEAIGFIDALLQGG
ncbi:MAG: TlpA disulfide reductase family protein [Hyphomonas sp.]